MKHIVYKTTFLPTGQYYIGKHSTNDLNDGYLGSGKIIKTLLSKYDKSLFERTILSEATDKDSLRELEFMHIGDKPLLKMFCV